MKKEKQVSKVFEVLNNVDVSALTDTKGKFKYLSWSNAVREASKLFPSITWEMTKWDYLPFFSVFCWNFLYSYLLLVDYRLIMIKKICRKLLICR